MPSFTFSPSAGRFRDIASGRFVPESSIVAGVDALVAQAAADLGALAGRMRAGTITAEAFQTELLATIKSLHVASALAAYGGRSQMTPERWGYTGSLIRAQYGYARAFVDDILSGRQPDGRLVQRARAYASAGRLTYQAVTAREARRRGLNEARNILSARESCDQCKALAARGWIPADEMVPVGGRTCGAWCRCSIERRRRSAAEAA